MSSYTVFKGNLGADAELKTSKGGTPYLSFTVANSTNRKLDNGEWETTNTTWKRVTMWDNLDALTPHLKKGAAVLVEGYEELRTWQKEDGGEGYSLDVTARCVAIIPRVPLQTNPVAQYPASTAAPVQQQGYAQQGQPPAGYAQPAPPAGYAAAATASSGWDGYDNGASPF
ncbi:single-stranded DNA-binding protein [Rothia mucilaginosa]